MLYLIGGILLWTILSMVWVVTILGRKSGEVLWYDSILSPPVMVLSWIIVVLSWIIGVVRREARKW